MRKSKKGTQQSTPKKEEAIEKQPNLDSKPTRDYWEDADIVEPKSIRDEFNVVASPKQVSEPVKPTPSFESPSMNAYEKATQERELLKNSHDFFYQPIKMGILKRTSTTQISPQPTNVQQKSMRTETIAEEEQTPQITRTTSTTQTYSSIKAPKKILQRQRTSNNEDSATNESYEEARRRIFDETDNFQQTGITNTSTNRTSNTNTSSTSNSNPPVKSVQILKRDPSKKR